MYERNAIIIERFFNNMFGFDEKNNIKINFDNYSKLIQALEKYKNITEEEEEIIIDYDIIANKIRDIQKKQEALNKKNLQYQQERNDLFQNIDEDANNIQKKIDNINKNIQNIDEEIKEKAQEFINVVAEFNEKSIIRTNCGKKRRMIEKDYNDILNETLDNYKNIDINLEKRAKQFIELDTTEIESELKTIIQKNGENEKIPFNNEVIEQSILLSIDIQKKETDLLANIYDKTSKLFSEIKNNTIKIEKHKKIILDSKSKLDFIATIKEYMVQFLDNERLASVNIESDYNKLMEESCKNLKNDLRQINNLYSLLIKEISKKATKKTYNDLYNFDYLRNLKNKAEEFENQVKKIKIPVAVINPNYWRVNGMKRIYDVFNKCVTENYNRDLKEFVPIEDIDYNNEERDDTKEHETIVSDTINNKDNYKEDEEQEDENCELEEKTENIKSEIDKKIDIILGLEDDDEIKNKKNNKTSKKNLNEDQSFYEEQEIESEEDWEDIEIDNDDSINDEWDEEDIENDDDIYDEWDDKEEDNNDDDNDDEWNDSDEDNDDFDDEWDDEEYIDNDEDIDDEWDEDDELAKEEDWDNYDIFGNDENIKNTDNTEIEDYDEEADYDIWGNNITKKEKKSKKSRDKIEKELDNRKENNNNNYDKDWENEFINIDKKDKNRKRGFFEKFIK